MAIENCKIVELPKIVDQRGNLTFIEAGRHVPFEFRRLYYLYDVPGGATRGGHGHRMLWQLMVALSGSFDVLIDDGRNQKRVTLNRPFQGLLICPMIWRELVNFSSGAVCAVMASDYYDEADYYRDYDSFIAGVAEQS